MHLDVNTIAVAVGLGDDEQLALDRRSVEVACELAETLGARLVLLHARQEPVVMTFPEIVSTYATLSEALRDLEARSLESLRRVVEERGLPVEVVSTPTGASVAEHIVDEARRSGADLLLLSSHSRHGAGRLFLGSVAERVAHLSPIPVLLLPRAASPDDQAGNAASRGLPAAR